MKYLLLILLLTGCSQYTSRATIDLCIKNCSVNGELTKIWSQEKSAYCYCGNNATFRVPNN